MILVTWKTPDRKLIQDPIQLSKVAIVLSPVAAHGDVQLAQVQYIQERPYSIYVQFSLFGLKEPPKDRFGALYASPLGNLRRFSSQFARIGQSWLDSAMIATVGEVDGYWDECYGNDANS